MRPSPLGGHCDALFPVVSHCSISLLVSSCWKDDFQDLTNTDSLFPC
jgi:hypothetical protein